MQFSGGKLSILFDDLTVEDGGFLQQILSLVGRVGCSKADFL